MLTWKQFTADIFEHKKRKNRQDRDQYLYTDVHEAIISAEQFEAVQVLFENKKHGYRGGVPIMQVVDMGVFRGYIPINHHWISEDPEIYYKASNSVPVYKKIKSHLIVPVRENLILPIMFNYCFTRQSGKLQLDRVQKMICTAFHGREMQGSQWRQKQLSARTFVIHYIRLWTGFPIIYIKFSEL